MLFGWWVIDISSLITKKSSHYNSFFITWKSPTYTQLCLALTLGWVFILKTQKFQLFVGPVDWLGAVETEQLPACGKKPLQFSLHCYYSFFPSTPNTQTRQIVELESTPTSSTQTQHPTKKTQPPCLLPPPTTHKSTNHNLKKIQPTIVFHPTPCKSQKIKPIHHSRSGTTNTFNTTTNYPMKLREREREREPKPKNLVKRREKERE